MNKFFKKALSDTSAEIIALVGAGCVSTLATTILKTFLPDDLKRSTKVACAIGTFIVSAVVYSEMETYLKAKVQPAVDSVLDAVDNGYPAVKLPHIQFESKEDFDAAMVKMQDIWNRKRYVTVGDFLDETIEDDQAAQFSDDIRNNWGWVEPFSHTEVELSNGKVIFVPDPCVEINKEEGSE